VICGWITRHVTVYYIAVLYERQKNNNNKTTVTPSRHIVAATTEKKANNLKSLYGPKLTILFLLSLGLIYIPAKRRPIKRKKKGVHFSCRSHSVSPFYII